MCHRIILFLFIENLNPPVADNLWLNKQLWFLEIEEWQMMSQTKWNLEQTLTKNKTNQGNTISALSGNCHSNHEPLLAAITKTRNGKNDGICSPKWLGKSIFVFVNKSMDEKICLISNHFCFGGEGWGWLPNIYDLFIYLNRISQFLLVKFSDRKLTLAYRFS